MPERDDLCRRCVAGEVDTRKLLAGFMSRCSRKILSRSAPTESPSSVAMSEDELLEVDAR